MSELDLLIILGHFIGYGFALVMMGISFLIGVILLKGYRENKSRRLLFLTLGFFSLSVACFWLFMEKFFLYALVSLQNPFLGIIAQLLGLYFNSIGMIFLGAFVYEATFPKHLKKLIIPGLILVLIYSIAATIDFFPFENGNVDPNTYEIIFSTPATAIFLAIFIPTAQIPVILICYYAYTMRRQSRPHAKRAVWMAVAYFTGNMSIMCQTVYPIQLSYFSGSLGFIALVIWFISVTRFNELEWPKKIQHVFLIESKSGVGLYDHSFVIDKIVGDETELISGYLAGITGLLQEITKSSHRLKYLDHEDVKILLEYGAFTTGALLTRENFSILRKKLKQLIAEFEGQHQDHLAKFKGNVSNFKDSQDLVEQIFSFKELIDKEKSRF